MDMVMGALTRARDWHHQARRVLVGFIIFLGIMSGVLLFDRAAPFSVVSVEPAFARPGEVVKITMRVSRDERRHCSAEFSRYIFDSDESRYFVDHSIASAKMIREIERRQPGYLTIAFVVPPRASAGPARLVTSLEYACNRPQALLWPIEVTTSAPFTILP